MASITIAQQAVVGIDIGTAASGFAFSFIDAPNDINDGDLPKNPRYHKAPTVLLTDANGDFKAFGLDAIEEYSQDEQNQAR
jgi:hypothetical protein